VTLAAGLQARVQGPRAGPVHVPAAARLSQTSAQVAHRPARRCPSRHRAERRARERQGLPLSPRVVLFSNFCSHNSQELKRELAATSNESPLSLFLLVRRAALCLPSVPLGGCPSASLTFHPPTPGRADLPQQGRQSSVKGYPRWAQRRVFQRHVGGDRSRPHGCVHPLLPPRKQRKRRSPTFCSA
jgi:hypothetical protein